MTRADISAGYKIVQTAHAVADFAEQHPTTFNKWKIESNSIICLAIENETALLQLAGLLSKQTDVSVFYEPDISEHTSICFYATPQIRKSLKSLKLLK